MSDDDDYIFSKGLRDHVSQLGDMDIRDPAVFDHLLKYAMGDDERKRLWDDVGRPDLYNCLENREND